MTPSAILSTRTRSPILTTPFSLIRGLLVLSLCLGSVAPVGADPLVYVTHLDDNTVSVIDTATQTVVATIDVGARPELLVAHPGGTLVYVTNVGDSTISAIDTATNSVVATIGSEALRSAVMGTAMHPDGPALYLALESQIVLVETATQTVTDIIDFPRNPMLLAVHPRGTALYVVTLEISDNLLVLDLDTLRGDHDGAR